MANNYFALQCLDYNGAPQYIKFARFSIQEMNNGWLRYNSTDCFTHLLEYGTDLRVLLNPNVIPLKASATVSDTYYFPIYNLDNRYLGIKIIHYQNDDDYDIVYSVCSKDSNNNYVTILKGFSSMQCYCTDCSDIKTKWLGVMKPQIAYGEYNNDNVIGTFIFSYNYNNNPETSGSTFSDAADFYQIPHNNVSNYTFDEVFGESSVLPSYPTGGVEPVDVFGGDENNFDGTSDDIGVPEPLTGALDNGFIKSYLISAQQLYQFMADLTNFNSSSVTDFFNNISLLFNNPIDSIISVKKFCLDFTQFPISNAENVYLLSFQTTATANPIYQQYIKLDIGSIDIDEYFGGFLDYPPYTRITIYLPFIGEQELNVQEVMGATIHLYYMVDFLTGNCVAHLNVEKTAGESTINSDLYQWEGNMACDIPITGSDQHQVFGNFGKNAVLDLVSGVTANIGGIINGFDGMMGSVNTGKVLSGAISGASALMGVRVPYIKIENAIQSMPENFTELKGMRDGIQHTLNELSGYASVMAVNIDNVTATDDEKALIKSILMEGIII